MKKLFKFRMLKLKWFTFYLFPRDRYEIGIGFDNSEGEWPLLSFSLIFISFDITFAPDSWFNPPPEEVERIRKIQALSPAEKEKLAVDNIYKALLRND